MMAKVRFSSDFHSGVYDVENLSELKSEVQKNTGDMPIDWTKKVFKVSGETIQDSYVFPDNFLTEVRVHQIDVKGGL